MKLETNFSLNGYLKITKVYLDGYREVHYDGKNIIVLTAKQAILSGIYLPNQTSNPVTTLWIGTGGTIDPAGQFPKPVNQSLTNLYAPLTSVSTSYTIDNTYPSVTFLATVDNSTASGSLITEAGLFTQSGSMFNIRTFPGISKSSEFAINFEWSIELS